MSTAIIIKPSQDDRWDLADQTPFIGHTLPVDKEGFMIINDDSITDDDFELLTGRYTGTSPLLNGVDFMQKTFGDTFGENKSSGIGGLSKLKDFNIVLFNRLDLREKFLYDREVEIRDYESTNLSTLDFVGTVTGVSYDRLKSINITLQGKFATNNPRIKGTPFVDDSGKTVNTFIVIGDTDEETLVKLDKKKGSEGIQLFIDQSKYDIKNIFIKEQNVDEYFKISSKWSINNNLVNFEDNVKLRLVEDIDDKEVNIKVLDGLEVLFDTTYSSADKDYIHVLRTSTDWEDKDLDISSIKNYTLTYKITERKTNNTDYYAIGDPFYNQYKGNDILQGASYFISNDPVLKLDGSAINITATVNKVTIIDEEKIRSDPLMNGGLLDGEESVDWKLFTPFNFLYRKPPYMYKYSETRAKVFGAETPQEWYQYSDDSYITPLDDNDRSQTLIQIGDEKMLVLAQDYKIGKKGYKTIKVVRGYDGTEPKAHTTEEEIVNLSSEVNQKPVVKIKSSFEVVQDYSVDELMLTKYNDFLSSRENYIWKNTFRTRQHYNYLFIKFNLPNIIGDVYQSPYLRYKVFLSDYTVFNEETQPIHALQFAMTRRSALASPFNNRNSFGHNSKIDKGWNYDNLSDRIDENQLYGVNSSSIDMLRFMSLNTWFDGDDFEDNGTYYLKGTGVSRFVEVSDDNSSVEDSFLFNFQYRDTGDESEFNIQEYDDLKNSLFALRMVNVNSLYTWSANLNIDYLKLNYKLKCPIKDNDWYAEVKYKGTDINIDIPVDTVNIGDNASIHLENINGIDYLFAESDQKPFVIYSVSKQGLLALKDEALLIDYPEIAQGFLGQLDENDEICKVALKENGFYWVESESETVTIVDELKDAVTLGYDKIGTDEVETDDLYITIDNGFIKVFNKVTTKLKNPIDILERLLLDFADHESSDLDTISFDYWKEYFNQTGHKATIIQEEEINANVVVDEFCKNFALICYENNLGKIAITHIKPPDESQVLTQLDITQQGLFTNSGLPDINIERIDSRQLITDLTLRYKPQGNIYKEEILSDDLPAPHQKLLSNARLYNKNSCEVALGLKCVRDKDTALYLARIKLQFHIEPTRFITMKLKPDNYYDIGTWFEIPTNDFILDTDNKAYILINTNKQSPEGKKEPFFEVTLFEFDLRFTAIQELPNFTRNDGYQEEITATDAIQEVLDGD